MIGDYLKGFVLVEWGTRILTILPGLRGFGGKLELEQKLFTDAAGAAKKNTPSSQQKLEEVVEGPLLD
jgi:hypothetical protein